MSQIPFEWWTRFTHDILPNPKLTEVVAEVVESENVSMLTSELADRVEARRHELDGEAALDDDEEYQQNTLSSDLWALEEHGIVRRVAKTNRDDQSVILKNQGITEFLSRQDLRTPAPGEMAVGDECWAEMEYTLDAETNADDSVRLPMPLEAKLYAIVSKYATVSAKHVTIEHGTPETFSADAEAIAQTLYEEEGAGEPLVRFPQHHDSPDEFSHKFHDFGLIAVVEGVESVANPLDLQFDLRRRLFRWSAASMELYTRQTDDAAAESITDDQIGRRAAQLPTSGTNPIYPHASFRAVTEGERLLIGFNVRIGLDSDTDPISEPDGGETESTTTD